jgi:nicotinamide-nucleotide amidase
MSKKPSQESTRTVEASIATQVDEIAAAAARHQIRVGVAESLTSGQLAADLGAGPDASRWFRGGIVAYAPQVKFDLLGVTPGPVVTAGCVRQMARGAARALGADAVVATTGVGGPDPEEGEPPGTVYVGVLVGGHETCRRLDLGGDPDTVLAQTRAHALTILLDALGVVADEVSARPRPGTARDGGPAGSPSPAASR